jgi:ABC-type branched-subunit amino acid transport system ATPase component
MALWSRKAEDGKTAASTPALVVENLDVYYGRAHALQQVSFALARGVYGIVGRNGMGKTTLCNAITGLVPSTGSVRVFGQELRGLPANQRTRLGVAYVPQGRRVWPSLSVDETLRLVAPKKRDVERVYALFPRLAERKGNGGAQLSGGEQQMLAIGRALLLEPKVLVMDEPTEGLAPVIVQQVEEALRNLAAEGEIAVLLIEQNLGVAIDVADTIGVMVNGRIAEQRPARELAADRALQERLLGVRSGGEDDDAEIAPPPADDTTTRVFTVRRAHGDSQPALDSPMRATASFNRWDVAPSASAPTPTPVALAPAGRPPATPAPATSGLVFDFRSPRRPPAPPTSSARSTPRGGSSSSCATAWRSGACASSRWTSPRPVAPRSRASIRGRWRATIRRASRPSSPAIGATP